MTSYKKIALTATVELTWLEKSALLWREGHAEDGQENPFLAYYDTLITGVPVVAKTPLYEGTLPEYCYPEEYTEANCEEDMRYERNVVWQEYGIDALDDCYPF